MNPVLKLQDSLISQMACLGYKDQVNESIELLFAPRTQRYDANRYSRHISRIVDLFSPISKFEIPNLDDSDSDLKTLINETFDWLNQVIKKNGKEREAIYNLFSTESLTHILSKFPNQSNDVFKALGNWFLVLRNTFLKLLNGTEASPLEPFKELLENEITLNKPKTVQYAADFYQDEKVFYQRIAHPIKNTPKYFSVDIGNKTYTLTFSDSSFNKKTKIYLGDLVMRNYNKEAKQRGYVSGRRWLDLDKASRDKLKQAYESFETFSKAMLASYKEN